MTLALESPTTKSKDGSMTTKALTTTKRELATVETDRAATINAEHAACEGAYANAVEHAYNAGELLKQVKDALTRGEWLPWLKEHFEFTPRTAQMYMRIAERLPNAKAPSHLTVDATLKQLAAPKTEEEKLFAECDALEAQIECAARAEKRLASLLREQAPDDATLTKIADRGRRTVRQLRRLRDKAVTA